MTTPMLKPFSYEHHDNQQRQQHSVLHRSKHSRSSLGNSHHGSSMGNLTPRSRDYRQSAETFQLKAALSPGAERGYRQSYTSVCSSGNHTSEALSPTGHAQAGANQLGSGLVECVSPSSPPHSPARAEACECRASDYLLSRSVDHLERPSVQALCRPGQLLCCGSVDLLSGGEGYPRVRPTLVIPAHYMRLPGEHPLSGQALLLQTDQQSDLETIQAELNASHSQQPLGQAPAGRSPDPAAAQADSGQLGLPESLSIPTALGETGALVEINSEDTLLAEKTLMELRGGKPLPHPRAWFVSLDGRSNAHIRHSYIDLQRAGCHGGGTGEGRRGNDASLDSGVDLNEPRAMRKGRDRELEEREVEKDRSKVTSPATYTQLVFADETADKGTAPASSPQDSNTEALQVGDKEGQQEEEEQMKEVPPSQSSSSTSADSSPASPPPLPSPDQKTFRTEEALLSICPDGDTVQDDGEEEKKSPWQRREERPLLAFNLK